MLHRRPDVAEDRREIRQKKPVAIGTKRLPPKKLRKSGSLMPAQRLYTALPPDR